MSDDDVRDCLARTRNLNDSDVRELLEQMPIAEQRELRLQCVRELAISVLHTLQLWVAEEGDRHGVKVIGTAVEGLIGKDSIGEKLAPKMVTCERCKECVFTDRGAELPECPVCGGPMARPA